jgi:3-oxoacyl-[acyl-carrier-protein] synthase II
MRTLRAFDGGPRYRLPGLASFCASLLPPDAGGPDPRALAEDVERFAWRLPPNARIALRLGVASVASLGRRAPSQAVDAIKTVVLLVAGSQHGAVDLLAWAAEMPLAQPDPVLDITPVSQWPTRSRVDVVVIGSGAGGIATYTAQQGVMDKKGPQRMNPLMIPMITVDAAGIAVAIRYGFHGPCIGVSSACATGADAITVAFDTIRRGDADVMITGGTEAAVTPLGIAGFGNLGVLSKRNATPAEASRPFDAGRDGFVLSEGAGVLVLESLESAVRRDVEPLAEILACANTMDAVHLTSPDQSSAQVVRAIQVALSRAQVTPDRVDYINAHAPSTPLGDPLEVQAYRKVFGEHRVAISSTKSTTGHCLGAAGAIEAIFCVQSLREKCLPPTINYQAPDPSCEIDCVPNVARFTAPEVVLSSALGFGGHNTVLVFARSPR